MLHNFVICGHTSHQQESSGRVILDLSDYLWYVLICYCILMYHMLKKSKLCQNILNPMESMHFGSKPKAPHRSHMLIKILKYVA